MAAFTGKCFPLRGPETVHKVDLHENRSLLVPGRRTEIGFPIGGLLYMTVCTLYAKGLRDPLHVFLTRIKNVFRIVSNC